MEIKDLRIWDGFRKQWLKPMCIDFSYDAGGVSRVAAMELHHKDPIKDGFFTFEKDDLKHIAITGDIRYNTDILPEDE